MKSPHDWLIAFLKLIGEENPEEYVKGELDGKFAHNIDVFKQFVSLIQEDARQDLIHLIPPEKTEISENKPAQSENKP